MWKAKIHRMKENMQLLKSAECFRNYGELEGITTIDIVILLLELKEQHRVNMMQVNSAIRILSKQITRKNTTV